MILSVSSCKYLIVIIVDTEYTEKEEIISFLCKPLETQCHKWERKVPSTDKLHNPQLMNWSLMIMTQI